MVFSRNPSFRRPFFKLSIEADRRKAIIAARGTKAPDEPSEHVVTRCREH
jgi:hypothetical protein